MRLSRGTRVVAALAATSLVLAACGGDDDAAPDPPPAEEEPAAEVPDDESAGDDVAGEESGEGGDAPDVAGADEVVAAWIQLDEQYEASRDDDDPFSDEAQAAFQDVVTSAMALLPDSLPVPDAVNPTFGYGMQRDDACVANLRLSADLVNSMGVGVGDGADRDGVGELFEAAFGDGSWEVEFDEPDRVRYLYDDGSVTWQLDLFDAFSGDHSSLDFCPLEP